VTRHSVHTAEPTCAGYHHINRWGCAGVLVPYTDDPIQRHGGASTGQLDASANLTSPPPPPHTHTHVHVPMWWGARGGPSAGSHLSKQTYCDTAECTKPVVPLPRHKTGLCFSSEGPQETSSTEASSELKHSPILRRGGGQAGTGLVHNTTQAQNTHCCSKPTAVEVNAIMQC
jgi:hypothetical protein